MYFLVKCEKPKVFQKTLEQTQGPQKNPRTQDSFEKPKILGENSRGGNAGCQPWMLINISY